MKFSSTSRSPLLEHRAFLLLVALVSVAFLFVLAPFYGAVFWGAIIAFVKAIILTAAGVLVIGPVVAAMFIAVWHLFTQERLGDAAMP